MKHLKLFENFLNEIKSSEIPKQAETVMEFTTDKGKKVEVKEFEGPGMAGEPMTFMYIFLDGESVKLEDLELEIEMDEYKAIENHLKAVAQSNYDSAMSWIE